MTDYVNGNGLTRIHFLPGRSGNVKKMRINDKNDTNSTVKVNSVQMKWNIPNAATNEHKHTHLSDVLKSFNLVRNFNWLIEENVERCNA